MKKSLITTFILFFFCVSPVFAGQYTVDADYGEMTGPAMGPWGNQRIGILHKGQIDRRNFISKAKIFSNSEKES